MLAQQFRKYLASMKITYKKYSIQRLAIILAVDTIASHPPWKDLLEKDPQVMYKPMVMRYRKEHGERFPFQFQHP